MKAASPVVVLALVAGCTENTDTAFHVRGRLEHTRSITDVVATTPSHIAHRRVAAPVSEDGSFELSLEPGNAWVVTFANGLEVGPAMQVGTLRLGSLDALVPQAAGDLDLGTVTLHDGRIATSDVAWSEVLSTLGLDDITAERIGASDDLARRYANPDIDGNGVLDAREPERDIRLDFYTEVTLTVDGRDFGLDDLLHSHRPADIGSRSFGTEMLVGMPSALTPMEPRQATFTFEQPFYGTDQGPDTPAVAAGSPVTEPHVLQGTVDGYPVAALYARSGRNVPHGTYEYALADTRLTFTDVDMPGDAAMGAALPLVVPFLRFVPRTQDCVTDCTLLAIEYSWMRRTYEGWLPATAAEVPQRATFDMLIWSPSGTSQYAALDLPAGPSGSIAWDGRATIRDGVSTMDLATVTTGQLCGVGVVYTNQIGIRTASQVANPAVACGAL